MLFLFLDKLIITFPLFQGSNIFCRKIASALKELNPNYFKSESGTKLFKFRRNVDWTSVLEQLSDFIKELFANDSRPCVEYSMLLSALMHILREMPGTYM